MGWRAGRWVAVAATTLTFALSSGTALAGGGGFNVAEDLFDGNCCRIDTADFNHDGYEDVVAEASAAVALELGDGAGGFESGDLPTSGINTNGLVTGDLDEDGLDDILSPYGFSMGPAATFLLRGLGDDRFESSSFNHWSPDNIAIGDFDGDGDDDFVTTSNREAVDGYEIATGNGTGGFAFSGLNALAPDSALTAVAVADVNDDGDDDLLVAKETSNVVVVMTGSTGTTFNAPASVSVGGPPHALAVADVDNDNDLDFIAPVGTNTAAVRFNDGNGGFTAGDPIILGGEGGGVAVGDFDSDGSEDLAFEVNDPDSFNDLLVVRFNNGVGGFFSSPPGSPFTTSGGDGTGSLEVGDFNSDGNQDVLSHSGDGLFGTGEPLLDGNLIVNGDAEGAGAARGTTTAPRPPGWNDGSTFGGDVLTYVRYGSPGSIPRRDDADRWEGGQSLFAGGPDTDEEVLTQTVDVSNRSQAIDRGEAIADLQADLGGYKATNDRMSVSAKFRDADGFLIAAPAFELAAVTNAARNDLTMLVRREATQPVPAGTRKIQVTLTATHDAGTYNNAYADNVGLFMDGVPLNPEPQGPGGGPGPGGVTNPPVPRKKCKKKFKLKRGKCVKKKRKKKRPA